MRHNLPANGCEELLTLDCARFRAKLHPRVLIRRFRELKRYTVSKNRPIVWADK